MRSVPILLLVLICSLVVWAGCSCSRFPAPPEPPDLSPADAGKQAVTQYDGNSDGKLDAEEIKQCPALLVAVKRIDTNGDGALTAEEIGDRIQSWLNSGTTLMSGSTSVTLDGKPLEGATVTFEPEPFLGPSFRPCSGATDESGLAAVKGTLEQYPGIYLGLYRVRISKEVNGQETLPARYNAESELGYEIADDLPGVGTIVFELTSR